MNIPFLTNLRNKGKNPEIFFEINSRHRKLLITHNGEIMNSVFQGL